MSKVFVFGGSGRVGKDLIKDLVVKGYDVVAGARHPERIVKMDHVTPVKVDLHGSVDDLMDKITGCDIIYFTAGSRGQDLIQTDAMGAIKTMIAAEKVGIKRYVMLSSMLSLNINKWKTIPELEDYLAARFFADKFLMDSTELEYTIIQPTNLVEEKGTGKISLNNSESQSNPIPDVAQVLTDVLKFPATKYKVIEMTGGDTPIDKALEQVK
ncbi:MAG: NAD(P)H-binding protein [Lactobacillus kefiranofaciens]|uniref:NAD(P)H-binding protein n=1 Tax=Lactobacillus kefiranofaciens TaxID=267818 RepID=UPI00166DD596|nr:NAD(P)H-binding protein [Lactobacillus kefiranofaciens]MCJ2172743.1 NAD(P)H-binding protein [Lactobacillus kefiranofaciens]QNT44119.1 NAD(P)H-binding protein [Lactobacillus kefiranofaciens]